MEPRKTALFGQFVVLCLIFVGIGYVFTRSTVIPSHVAVATSTLPAAAALPIDTATTTIATATPPQVVKPSPSPVKKPIIKATKTASPATSTETITRLPNPYSTPPLPLALVNERAREALVNILCTTSTGLVLPISGSGVIIDPRGVILTNAHVAQYVLLSENSGLDLECYIRTGSPATAHWIPKVLYIPPVWVSAHASEITSSHVLGTGEHDYALLYIARSMDGTPLPSSFPALVPDVREGIGFVDDSILVASYPAEFLGGLAATNALYAASADTSVKQLMTFTTDTVDVYSLGGVILAQSGSSGGAAANAWGYLIGLITTTSEAPTTADRDLRAVTLAYINRDIMTQTGFDLPTILGGDPVLETQEFTTREAPQLIALLLKQIRK